MSPMGKPSITLLNQNDDFYTTEYRFVSGLLTGEIKPDTFACGRFDRSLTRRYLERLVEDGAIGELCWYRRCMYNGELIFISDSLFEHRISEPKRQERKRFIFHFDDNKIYCRFDDVATITYEEFWYAFDCQFILQDHLWSRWTFPDNSIYDMNSPFHILNNRYLQTKSLLSFLPEVFTQCILKVKYKIEYEKQVKELYRLVVEGFNNEVEKRLERSLEFENNILTRIDFDSLFDNSFKEV